MSNTITEAQERWRLCVTDFVLSGILISVHLYLFCVCVLCSVLCAVLSDFVCTPTLLFKYKIYL